MRLERGVESFYSYHKIWGSSDSHRVGGNFSPLLALSSSQSSQQRVIIIIERGTAVRSQIMSDLFSQIPKLSSSSPGCKKEFIQNCPLTHVSSSNLPLSECLPDVPRDRWQMPRVQSTGANCQLSVSF